MSNFENGRASAGQNGLGIAGFVVSLVGLWLCCGWLSPIGLLMSAIALAWTPRGFALAGTILGGIGSLLLVFIGYATVVGFMKFEEAVENFGHQIHVAAAAIRIDTFYEENMRLPNDEEAREILDDIESSSEGTAKLRYVQIDETHFEVIAAGADGEFGTDDDVSTDPRTAGESSIDDIQIDGELMEEPLESVEESPALEEAEAAP